MPKPCQIDLFTPPLLPGLSQADDIVTAAEEQALIAAIDSADLQLFRFRVRCSRNLATIGKLSVVATAPSV